MTAEKMGIPMGAVSESTAPPFRLTCGFCNGGPGWHYSGCPTLNHLSYYAASQPPTQYCHSCAALAAEVAQLRRELLAAIEKLSPTPSRDTPSSGSQQND